MTDKTMQRLKTILGEVYDLDTTYGLLAWDQQTYMPPGGSTDRSFKLSTLARISHNKFASQEVGDLLSQLESNIDAYEKDSHEQRLIKVARHNYEKATRVPAEWVAEFARLTTVAHAIWEKARKESNFELFRPSLERIVKMKREYAGFFAPYEHIYDPLLDDYEPGMKTSTVKRLFEQLKTSQVKLVQKIQGKEQVPDWFLYQDFERQDQWDLGIEVIDRIGFDWMRGRLDTSTHPFTNGFSINDVRITTRVEPKIFTMAFFATLHECGHALYELGIDPSLRRTPLAVGASLAIHESQSRLWENIVGRSLSFWQYFFPRVQHIFPDQFGEISLDRFYRGINKVAPSLIRIEADEATYNLHIMLRLELEIAMLKGDLLVGDLPGAWNELMEQYLGVVPDCEADGVLQDVHWSGGMMGYFPTYALGNLISVQLWEQLKKDIPTVSSEIAAGEFGELLDWLRDNIHQYGAKFEPQELVKKVTGSEINPQPYLDYLWDKYGKIYKF